jgi:hypothetical protein
MPTMASRMSIAVSTRIARRGQWRRQRVSVSQHLVDAKPGQIRSRQPGRSRQLPELTPHRLGSRNSNRVSCMPDQVQTCTGATTHPTASVDSAWAFGLNIGAPTGTLALRDLAPVRTQMLAGVFLCQQQAIDATEPRLLRLADASPSIVLLVGQVFQRRAVSLVVCLDL